MSEYTEEPVVSRRARRWAIAAGVAVTVVLAYLFCVALPTMYIPKGTTLTGIVKVDELRVKILDVETRDVVNHEDQEILESRPTKQRLIMIGDIHGHYRKFRKLLRKVKWDKHNDQLLVLGDFITKGPDSLKVLDFLIDNDIECILGNHEWNVLLNYAQFRGLAEPAFVAGDGLLEFMEDKFTESLLSDDPEFRLAKKLHPRHVHYINLCPMMKKLGKVPVVGKKKAHGVAHGVAVHGGLRWDLLHDLNDQNPHDCLEMRLYLKPFFNETTDDPDQKGAVSWLKIWNKKQDAGEPEQPIVVYYGHDAGRGLKLKKWSNGLDLGCYKGGELSALVLLKSGNSWNEELVQVSC